MKAFCEFSGVIFDLDGLVLDTESSYFAAWKMAAGTMGYVLDDAFLTTLSCLHYQAVEKAIKRRCGGGFDIEKFSRLSSQCWQEWVNKKGLAIKHGFHDMLGLVQQNRLPFCLATNSHSKNARQCLQLAGIENVFETIIGREQVQTGKPSPEIIFQAARAMRVPVENCLVLEDSLTGVRAAKRAGAYCVLLPSTPAVEPVARELADQTVDNLAVLAANWC